MKLYIINDYVTLRFLL